MKASIDVRNRDEGDAIKRAFEDPTFHAFAILVGVLANLPTDRARRRVLSWVADKFDEDFAGRVEAPTNGDGLRLKDGGSSRE